MCFLFVFNDVLWFILTYITDVEYLFLCTFLVTSFKRHKNCGWGRWQPYPPVLETLCKHIDSVYTSHR